MASRKNLKKEVKSICGELFADCVALSMCEQGNPEKLQELMAKIVAIYQDYVTRISHTEKGSEKLFYKKLRSEFADKANAISDEIIKA